ncbi:MAG: riboflavin biosynthesis protein RibF [Deltaproteobacteria bacterium GWC2_42_11]|nr:MAG: riboflavin biosynthesis protein RibF [Deltaproteobacteria bacterium GWC2_42_11]HBO83702.1 bifunctional riboflavin kinase/FAD synthetase [Deltaproteobacteria bacterium]
MKIIKSGRRIKSSVLTLGNFDGVHLGHQQILKKVRTRANMCGCPSIVYTFEPHPVKVVAPERSLPLITTFDDKIELLSSFDIDFLVCADFTREFASQHPGEFVKNELLLRLGVKEVWVGHDYLFGRGKEGTVDYLKELGKEFNFKAGVIPAFKKGGGIVSSSRIRGLILNGDVKKASALLGWVFSISGKVIKGRNRGKEIGFPTANIYTLNELIPGRGVYAAYCRVKGKILPAVVSIGANPTFGDIDSVNIEAHVIDFNGNLYGKNLRIHFVKRIRDEIKFKNPDKLVSQIKMDIKKARGLL